MFPTEKGSEQVRRLISNIHKYLQTHAMATHHGGTGQLPLEDAQTQENNVVPPYEPQEEIDIIEQNEQFKDLTNTVDDL